MTFQFYKNMQRYNYNSAELLNIFVSIKVKCHIKLQLLQKCTFTTLFKDNVFIVRANGVR